MEQSFYNDDMNNQEQDVKKLKSSMTLDFASASRKNTNIGLLNSPDMRMLKLATPELEKFITSGVPTPNNGNSVYPTKEQDQYAQGFIDALARLRRNENQPDNVHCAATGQVTAQNFLNTISRQQDIVTVPITEGITQTPPVTSGNYTTLGPVLRFHDPVRSDASSDLSESSGSRTNSPAAIITGSRLSQLKEDESQIVPSIGSIASTPPLSPIDMEHQESKKLERKRARNRLAAAKCRTRKLERISVLEKKVKELKTQNNDLNDKSTQLKKQVSLLKQQIVDHVHSGCDLIVNHNVLHNSSGSVPSASTH